MRRKQFYVGAKAGVRAGPDPFLQRGRISSWINSWDTEQGKNNVNEGKNHYIWGKRFAKRYSSVNMLPETGFDFFVCRMG